MNKAEILNFLDANTHDLFTEDFLTMVNDAFGTSFVAETYQSNPRDPKGLTLNNGARSARGIAAFDLAPMLCRSFNVSYESKMGRGFQVRACTEALRKAGYDK